MLNEIPFSAEEEILHGLEMVFEMKLILEYVNKHSSYFLVCLTQPFSKDIP